MMVLVLGSIAWLTTSSVQSSVVRIPVISNLSLPVNNHIIMIQLDEMERDYLKLPSVH